MYWLIFGLFVMIDGVLDWMFYWVPMYVFVRLGLQVWLFNKEFAGAESVYKHGLQELLSKADDFLKVLTKDSVAHSLPEKKGN